MNLSSFWHAYDIYPLFIFNVNKNKTLSSTVIEWYLFRVAMAMLEKPSCSIHARPTRDFKDRMSFLFQNELGLQRVVQLDDQIGITGSLAATKRWAENNQRDNY